MLTLPDCEAASMPVRLSLPFPALFLIISALLFSGCYSKPGKYDYGPRRDASVSTRDTAASNDTGDDQQQQSQSNPIINETPPIYWQPNIGSAIADAQSEPDKQKLAVLVTDGQCGDCLKWERDYFTHPNVRKVTDGRYILVRVNVNESKEASERFVFDESEVPFIVFVSEKGNENGRVYNLPSTPQVFAQILIDRF